MKYQKIKCEKCSKDIGNNNYTKHVKSCQGMKVCPVCNIEHTKTGITCSYSCSNRYFRTGENNGNWKQDAYQTTCWLYHGKKCLICDEQNIVTVHHVNENHNDNRPENLVPLCPTHHQYVHSRYKDKVVPIIEEYVKNYLLRVGKPG